MRHGIKPRQIYLLIIHLKIATLKASFTYSRRFINLLYDLQLMTQGIKENQQHYVQEINANYSKLYASINQQMEFTRQRKYAQ